LLPCTPVKGALSTPRTNLKETFLEGRREGDGGEIVRIVVGGLPGPEGMDAAGLIEERTPRLALIRKGVALPLNLR